MCMWLLGLQFFGGQFGGGGGGGGMEDLFGGMGGGGMGGGRSFTGAGFPGMGGMGPMDGMGGGRRRKVRSAHDGRRRTGRAHLCRPMQPACDARRCMVMRFGQSPCACYCRLYATTIRGRAQILDATTGPCTADEAADHAGGDVQGQHQENEDQPHHP